MPGCTVSDLLAMCSAAGPLPNCFDSWPLVVRACEGHEDTQRALLGSSRLQELFASSAEVVLQFSKFRVVRWLLFVFVHCNPLAMHLPRWSAASARKWCHGIFLYLHDPELQFLAAPPLSGGVVSLLHQHITVAMTYVPHNAPCSCAVHFVQFSSSVAGSHAEGERRHSTRTSN
jgi:hypothetical protein